MALNPPAEKIAFLTVKIEDKVDPPNPDDLKESQVLLIRHATTQFNLEFQQVVSKHGEVSEEFEQLKIRKDLVDPPLAEIGLKQCENGREHINHINFGIVFVSPMLRTCQTAVELFKDHPNKKNIKFVLYPVAKEGLYLCNDFMKGPFKDQIYKTYSNPELCCGLNFDFTYIMGSYGCE